jgi:hypothetical protein
MSANAAALRHSSEQYCAVMTAVPTIASSFSVHSVKVVIEWQNDTQCNIHSSTSSRIVEVLLAPRNAHVQTSIGLCGPRK